ncbi:NAD-dependent epimerase/dehydratase family protein [Paenibacillus endophyticus]|uniref:NAD-dependent epimerase/dehydratase family protein n=1 Tax=Paenibacillus endophyticus TaxID=1294268 RepID=UPI0028AEC50F|nr:NAD-dependent epimerase/dehydratase family protein [Paenibacillus endophyticus]
MLAGATGLIGNALLVQLLRNPLVRKVTVLSRRSFDMDRTVSASEKAKLHMIVADLASMNEALAQVEADVVFCTLGTTIKIAKTREAFRRVDYEYPFMLAECAQHISASVFSVVTSMGADSGSRIFYSRVKGELQDALAGLRLPNIHVFQPSLLLGERHDVRPGEAFGAIASKGLAFAMIGPLRKYRPIKGEDVARAMVKAAEEVLDRDAASPLDGRQAAMQYFTSDQIADLAVHTTG